MGITKFMQQVNRLCKQRPAAASAGTRQNRRREEFVATFERISARYPGQTRQARRKMARKIAKGSLSLANGTF